jgi:hypothetical protein
LWRMNSTPNATSAAYWLCGAPQAHIGHARLAPARHGLGVIELQAGARRAALPGLAHERAPALVALPDRPLDAGRDLARVDGGPRPARPRPGGGGELLLLELGHQRRQGPLEHLPGVPGRHLVAEQGLGVARQVVPPLAQGEPHGEDPGPQGLHLTPTPNMPRGMLRFCQDWTSHGPRGLWGMARPPSALSFNMPRGMLIG